MARPQNFDREKVTKQAMNLFWEKGYSAVSVQDLASVMEISRSSFYNSFKDKESIFDASLEAYGPDSPCAPLETIGPGDAVIPVIKKMFYDICKNKAEDPDAKGCLMVNSIAGLDPSEIEVKNKLSARMFTGMGHFKAVMKQAQEQDELPPGTDSEKLALYLATLQMGLCLLSKVCSDEAMLRGVVDQGLQVLDKVS